MTMLAGPKASKATAGISQVMAEVDAWSGNDRQQLGSKHWLWNPSKSVRLGE